MTAEGEKRDYKRASEDKLIEWAKEGDRKAFEDLKAEYWHEVRGYIILSKRASKPTDVDEILARTWDKAWEKIDQYTKKRGSFPTWLKKCMAEYEVRNFRREEGTRDKREVLTSDLVEHVLPGEVLERLSREPVLPPEVRPPPEFYRALANLAFNKDRTPHHAIVYAFARLVEYTPEGVKYKPKYIVAAMSHVALRELEVRLEKEYVNVSALPPNQVPPCFERLRNNMGRRFGDVVQAEKTRETYPELLETIVGATVLEAYFKSCRTDEERAAKVNQFIASFERALAGEPLPPEVAAWLEGSDTPWP